MGAWTHAIPSSGTPCPPATKIKAKRASAAAAAAVGDNDDLSMEDEPTFDDDDMPAASNNKVTKAVLASAQGRIRPVIVAACEVFAQLSVLMSTVKVAQPLAVAPGGGVCSGCN